MNTTIIKKRYVSPASANPAGGRVRVLRGHVEVVRKPVLSEQTRRTFEFISDPANAHHFTKAAALKAFAHVKV